MGGARQLVTLADIALRAGVSRATAARSLAGRGYVSPEKRKAVTEAARDLGYVPNDIARSLRTRRTKVIGLLISDPANPFYGEIAREVAAVARQAGYHVMLCTSGDEPAVEAEYLEVLERARVDGVIITATPRAATRLRDMAERGIPVVQIDRVAVRRGIDSVTVDNESAARAATEHLINAGHRRIGIITGATELMTGNARLAGYLAALRSHHIPVQEELIYAGSFLADHGRSATTALLQLSERPTAIFAANNVLAEWCYLTLVAEGLRVPTDVSLVGFDDVPWMRIVQPALTTVRQPINDMARLAGELLFSRLLGQRSREKHASFTSELVVRGSVREL